MTIGLLTISGITDSYGKQTRKKVKTVAIRAEKNSRQGDRDVSKLAYTTCPHVRKNRRIIQLIKRKSL